MPFHINYIYNYDSIYNYCVYKYNYNSIYDYNIYTHIHILSQCQ